MTDVTDDRQFDLLFDATIGDETVRDFLTSANPDAANAIARRFEEAITARALDHTPQLSLGHHDQLRILHRERRGFPPSAERPNPAATRRSAMTASSPGSAVEGAGALAPCGRCRAATA